MPSFERRCKSFPECSYDRMDSSELSESLRHFLQSNTPTFQAVELLLFLAAQTDRRWLPEDIVEAIKPTVITLSAVKEYLAVFRAQGLVQGDESVAFAPATPGLQSSVDELAQAFNERPVTLIRTIYELPENKIRSFADSFRLKKE